VVTAALAREQSGALPEVLGMDREELREAYGVGAEALRAAAAPSWLHQAISYRGINGRVEPDDRWWFAGEEQR